MSAARYDLVIDQGSDFAVEFTVAEAGVAKKPDWLLSSSPASAV